MLGKGRGKATYLRKRRVERAEVPASAGASVHFLGQGAAGGGTGTPANPRCPPISMQSRGLALRNFLSCFGGLQGRQAAGDTRPGPAEQHGGRSPPCLLPYDGVLGTPQAAQPGGGTRTLLEKMSQFLLREARRLYGSADPVRRWESERCRLSKDGFFVDRRQPGRLSPCPAEQQGRCDGPGELTG